VSAHCAWCRESTHDPVAVGTIAQDTSSGGTIHACPTCQYLNNLMPMANWTHPGDGSPQYYPAKGAAS
jgi:hypothetical protein